MAAVPGSTPASDAGGALGQRGGPALAAAPWAPIAAAPDLPRPPSGLLQVRAPQLSPCCVAHASCPMHQARQRVGRAAPFFARACSQAIAAPGSRTVGCTGTPSQQPLLVCAPHFVAHSFTSSTTCQPPLSPPACVAGFAPVAAAEQAVLQPMNAIVVAKPAAQVCMPHACMCPPSLAHSACSMVDAIHRPPRSCPPPPHPPCAQAPDADPANEAVVRAVLLAHFERGEPGDYVQLKDVAVALEAQHPSCHRRLCFKAGTRLPNNEALAAVVSRVTGLQVRNAQATLSGHVKVRGLIKGYRKVRAELAASHAPLATWPRRAGRWGRGWARGWARGLPHPHRTDVARGVLPRPPPQTPCSPPPSI